MTLNGALSLLAGIIEKTVQSLPTSAQTIFGCKATCSGYSKHLLLSISKRSKLEEINMEISDTNMGIYYMSKLFALAPFSIRRNTKGVGVLEIRRCIFFSVYSLSLIIILVFLTYQGLLFDANSKIPIRASFRMKSATSKVVTALDVSVVVLSTVAGVFCGFFGLRSTRELNQRLLKVDDSLHTSTNLKRDRLRSLGMLILPMFLIAGLLVLDVWTWLRFANVMKIDEEDTELNVQWYIPFYSLYFILTGLQIGFANTAFGLGRRYSRLNLMLRCSFLADGKKDAHSKQKITTVMALLKSPPTLSSLNASTTKLGVDTHNENAVKTKVILLKVLAENHESLGKCVAIVSSSYGMAVLFILVSCLLHLVATAYFLFLELLNTKDYGYVWLQILWIFFHAFRLLMVVEPCHLAQRESKKTIQIICEIERKVHDPILAEEVKKFWQQLLVLDAEFSACGLCKVNRNILTSFSSAIATYLVILIQFQKTNG